MKENIPRIRKLPSGAKRGFFEKKGVIEGKALLKEGFIDIKALLKKLKKKIDKPLKTWRKKWTVLEKKKEGKSCWKKVLEKLNFKKINNKQVGRVG